MVGVIAPKEIVEMEANPTAENIAELIAGRLAETLTEGVQVRFVVLYETEKCVKYSR